MNPRATNQAGKIAARVIVGVPVLLAKPEASAPFMPTVLWFHGFRADALAHAAELERCAEAGFLAVGIDASGHGARRDTTMADRIASASGGALSVVLDLVEETVRELPALVDALVREHGADPTRISVVGISMGAFLAYRAVVTGPPLRAVVALLGSPTWTRATSPHTHHDAFRHVALLSITAEHDVSVPPASTRVFHQQLAMIQPTSPTHRHHELRGAGHLTSAAEWSEAMRLTMDWLREHG